MESNKPIMIRPMTDQDLPAVIALYRDMYAEQKQLGMVMTFNDAEIADMLAAQLKSKLFLLYAAECDAGITGFGIGAMIRASRKFELPVPAPFLGFIHDVYVTPDARGRGTAGRLVQALEEHFAREGISYVELHVLSGNEPGRRFWSSQGYNDVLQVMYKQL